MNHSNGRLIASLTQARADFADLINRASYGGERIVLERRGKQLAALVPIEDLDLIQDLEDKVDARDIAKALKETEQSGTISLEKVEAELGL
jgi:prevent-host-death family protein